MPLNAAPRHGTVCHAPSVSSKLYAKRRSPVRATTSSA
jgi:hypothetical protein